MRVAFVLALIVSSLVFPLQSALAVTSPTVTIDAAVLVGLTQLDTHDIVVVEGQNITVHLPGGDKTIQAAIVNVNGDTTKCSSVDITGCPEPTQAVLSGCSDERTYFITPGGPGVGVFDNGDTIDGTVFNGNISMTCKSIPPPTATTKH